METFRLKLMFIYVYGALVERFLLLSPLQASTELSQYLFK